MRTNRLFVRREIVIPTIKLPKIPCRLRNTIIIIAGCASVEVLNDLSEFPKKWQTAIAVCLRTLLAVLAYTNLWHRPDGSHIDDPRPTDECREPIVPVPLAPPVVKTTTVEEVVEK